MLGFRARAITTDIHCKDGELEEARWFTKDEIRAFGTMNDSGPQYKMPPPYAIARHMIGRWLKGEV
jgi:NAD+ diphosphatase